MRIIFRLISDKLFKNNKSAMLVGRWNIDYDNVIQERKVYLTNMDHCGCCGNISSKNTTNKELSQRLPKKTQKPSSSKYIK